MVVSGSLPLMNLLVSNNCTQRRNLRSFNFVNEVLSAVLMAELLNENINTKNKTTFNKFLSDGNR